MEIHVTIIGVILIPLAIVHIIFPKYFKWEKELKGLSLINRQMIYVHTLFVALIILLMGIMCITSAHELVFTNLGRKVSLGVGIFWLIRLFVQFFGYSSKLWKGKLFETVVHILFTLMWVYMSVMFLIIYFID